MSAPRRARGWRPIRSLTSHRGAIEQVIADMPCTKCGQGTGEPCITSSGRPSQPHTVRRKYIAALLMWRHHLDLAGGRP